MRDAINSWLSIILKVVAITALAAGLLWFGMSVVANATENNNPNELPKMPAMSKADMIVTIRTTGDVLLTKDYEVEASPEDPALLVYTLPAGHYEIVQGKWQWKDEPLSLDEYYWGEIELDRRTE